MSQECERVKQICRCMDELEWIRWVSKSGEWKKYGTSILDAQIGEMDWLWELHVLIHRTA